MDNKNFKNIALLVLLIVVMFFIFRNPLFLSPQVQEFTLNEFVEKAKNNEINTSVPLIVKGEDKIISGELKDGTNFKVFFLENYDVA